MAGSIPLKFNRPIDQEDGSATNQQPKRGNDGHPALRKPISEQDILARIFTWLILSALWVLACGRWVGSFYASGRRVAIGYAVLLIGGGIIMYFTMGPLA